MTIATYFFSAYIYVLYFFCFHSLTTMSFILCVCPRLNNRSFPRTRHRRKPLCYNINRIILNQMHSVAALQESVLSALNGRGRESERDIERVRGRNVLLSLLRNIDAVHFANWLRRPKFCSISVPLTLRNIQLKSDSARMLHDLRRGGMCSHLGLQPLPDRRFTGAMTPLITFGRWGEMDTVCFSPLSIFKTWAELSMVESLGLDLGLCPVAEAPGFAYGHTEANLDELKSINNIRRLMGNPYCISVDEKCRDIVMTPETTLALGAAWLHPFRFDKFVSLPVRSE